MAHLLRSTGCLVLVCLAAWACDSQDADVQATASDCRNAGQACGRGLECQVNTSGAYDCLPEVIDGGDPVNLCDGLGDGHVLMEGDYDACAFANDCVERGEQMRTNSVCRGGAPVNELETQTCERETDGVVLSEGEFDACVFADECVELGEQTRTNSVCRDGAAVNELETQACDRETDGVIVEQPAFGPCTFTDDCIEMGEMARTNSVCRGGVAVNEAEVQVCERDTDGVIVAQPEFEACAGFDDLCDLSGEQSRTNGVCRDGAVNDERETRGCERDDPGVTITPDRVAVCMTAAGGVLELDDSRLVVPADALVEPTEIYLERSLDAPLVVAGLSILGPIFSAGPADTALALPATVVAPFDGDRNRAALFADSDVGIRRLGGQVVGDEVIGQVQRLGVFLVADGVDYRLNADQSCAQLRTVEGRAQEPSTVALFFTVDDCAGRPLTELQVADFEVLEGDIPLEGGAVRRMLPGDGVQTFVSLALDLSDRTQPHLEALISSASTFIRRLSEDRGSSVQIGIELFAGDERLTRWQAPHLESDLLLQRLGAVGQFASESPESTNLHGAIIQGVDRLARDAEAFRARNRGGAFTTEHLVVFTSGVDTAGVEDDDAVRDHLAASAAEVTIIGLRSPDLSADALQSLSSDAIIAPDPTSLNREFQTVAAQISGKLERTYLLAYCSPQQAGEHTTTVRLAGADHRGTAQFSFAADAIAAPGCGDALFDEQCDDRQCGGLGCGYCDDRMAGCSPSDQCQSFCETDPVTVAVAVAERCDYPNPQGYAQFCEQDISTRCDGLCTDLANDPENCGRCGFDCGPNVVGVNDGERTVGVSCVDTVCQCAPGWYGEACDETRCGDGFLTPDEACDDGNIEGADGCSVDCVVESFWACDQNEPSQCDGIRGDGRVRGTEACDDGAELEVNQPVDGDGCSALGVIEVGFLCDGEPSVCTSRCGDGVVASDEPCDAGDGSFADGCSDTCDLLDHASCANPCDSAGTEPALAAVRLTLNGDGSPNQTFGVAVAVDGDAAIVGAPGFVRDGIPVGAAYLFDLRPDDAVTPYVSSAVFAEDGQAGDDFGASVDRVSSTAIIGAPARGDRAGAVYVFDREADGTWVQSVVTASDGEAGDRFGHGVAIAESGDLFVVSAYGDPNNGPSSGAVYVYERSRIKGAWRETKLTTPDGSANDEFGATVAVTDGAIIVGAAGDGELGEQSGSAYIFERQGDASWRAIKLTGAEEVTWGANDRFGDSVDISRGSAIVGAPLAAEGAGAAFIFDRQPDGRWTAARLATPEGVWGIGQTVSIDGDTAVLGQRLADAPGDANEWSDASYLYERPGAGDWVMSPVMMPAGLRGGPSGPSMDISAGSVIVGGGRGVGGADQAVFVFASARQCYADGEAEALCHCLAGAAGPDCAQRPELGDGVIQAAERCDDGNVESGDGCSDLGVIERGFFCDGEPSVCVGRCGDAIVVADESCDDGNEDDEDACSNACDFGGSHGQGWVQVASLPRAFNQTHHSFAFSFGGLGYIVSGSSSAGVRDDFYQYDPVEDVWTELEPFPGSARGFAIGDTWDGKAYFGFGSDGRSYLNDLWVFDPADMSWTELASCPCSARAHPALVARDGKVFVGLGNGSRGNLNDWWAYDIATNVWSQQADLPSLPRHHPFQFGIDDFVFTGFGHGNGIFNNWFRYDVLDETWTEVASLPAEGRVAGTQFSYDGMGYVLSGDGEDHRSMETGEFWEYDPVADTWLELPPHPAGSRWAPASFVINGEVYLINGTSFRRYVSEIYKYDLNASP